VLKFRSSNSIVIAPAKTGKARRSKTVVISTDHTKRGIFSRLILGVRIFKIVEIKLTAPRIEETPARWSEKIVKSTAGPL
jgi:ABC-type microcin C transport system permease subunit YejE